MKNEEIDPTLKQMVRDGLVEIVQEVPELKWKLTDKGLAEAAKMIRESGLSEKEFFKDMGLET